MTESYESSHEEEAKDAALVVRERAEGKSLCSKNKSNWLGSSCKSGVGRTLCPFGGDVKKFISADYTDYVRSGNLCNPWTNKGIKLIHSQRLSARKK